MTTKPAEPYPFIRAYGQMVGSFDAYIRQQIARATADNAPANALYRDSNGAWQTTDDILSAGTRRALGLDPLPPIPITANALVDNVADALRSSTFLRDRHGLTTVHADNANLFLTFTTGQSAVIRSEVSEPATTG